MIKIIIADDHPIIHSGLKQIIYEEIDMEVTCEAENASALFENLKKVKVDLIILDISMPGMSGVEAMEILHRDFPEIPVLVLSAMPEDQYGIRLLKCGASGFLHKDSAPDELVKAIRQIISGNRYVSSSLSNYLLKYMDGKNIEHPHQKLSNREFEVMCRIASGNTVTQIAGELFLSVKTISTYRNRILQKMNMKNSSEITHYCIKNKLVE